MELLLFRYEEFRNQYNCSLIKVEEIPLEERQSYWNGCILIALFLITEILYIPCMFSIWKRTVNNSCYKFLFFVGLTDMAVLWICGFFTGLFALQGVVFCSDPFLIYVLGTIGMAFWAAESFVELNLAINRCLEMSYPEIAHKLYSGHRTTLWLLGGSAYALFWLFGLKPILFNGLYGSWFFDPYIGYQVNGVDHNVYHNYVHSFHDTFMAFAFPLVYILFGINLCVRGRGKSTTPVTKVLAINVVPIGQNGNNNNWNKANKKIQSAVSQKKMFLQVAIISGFNFYACLLYVFMQYVQMSNAIAIAASYGWFFIHAIPPYIYLTLNKSIRQDCLRMVKRVLLGHEVTSTPNISNLARGLQKVTKSLKILPQQPRKQSAQ